MPRAAKLAVPAVCLAVFLIWLSLSPGGVLGKADAVGYAVCHRIASHSFFFEDRQMPLCARCSGMHLGALISMLYQFRLGKRGGMPAKKLWIPFGIFLLAFGFDGVNSYLTFGQTNGGALLPNLHPLYTPMNWLRAFTGVLTGLGIGAVLAPIFNQSMWKDWDPRPALASWKDLLILVGLGIVLVAALLSENVFLLYPLAILSTLTVLAILSMIYAIVWLMLLKRENSYVVWQDAWVVLLLAFTTAILQIGLMDFGRFQLTGTWEGFNL